MAGISIVSQGGRKEVWGAPKCSLWVFCFKTEAASLV